MHKVEMRRLKVVSDFRRVKWDELLVYVIGAMQAQEPLRSPHIPSRSAAP